jgi:hypothetical protein
MLDQRGEAPRRPCRRGAVLLVLVLCALRPAFGQDDADDPAKEKFEAIARNTCAT